MSRRYGTIALIALVGMVAGAFALDPGEAPAPSSPAETAEAAAPSVSPASCSSCDARHQRLLKKRSAEE